MQLNREKLRWQLNRYVPITAWLPAYPRDLLRSDIISGVTVWAVMVPVAMAYAEMAGLPPSTGSTPPLRRCWVTPSSAPAGSSR